jgi:adenylate cyclase
VRARIGGRDEIGQLAERMNQMIDGLRARMLMEKFVSPSAVALIERSAASERIALGGERQEVTVLFCDIRGFTTFSEQEEPEEVVRLVNAYLREQARLIGEYGGEVDKYMGDATMAVFTGPTMARDAVRCGLAIRAALAGDGDAPGRSGGVGINTGWVVRGTVGSPDRMEYTALGDAVNVAKRLCDAAAPGEVLVSAPTYHRVREEVHAEALAPLSVKGRRQTVEAYRLLDAPTG